MSSQFMLKQCTQLEWCIKQPPFGQSVESPVFMVNGNQLYFSFNPIRSSCNSWGGSVYDDWDPDPQYTFYQKLKNIRLNHVPYKVNFEIGYTNEETLSLGKGSFNVSETTLISSISCSKAKQLQYIKLRCYFDDVIPFLKNNNRKELQTDAIVGRPATQESQTLSNVILYIENIHLEALARDVSKLLNESSSSDVKIKCEDKTFSVHKTILSKRSAVFSAMLESKMIESETGSIEVEDFNSSILEGFLRYLYSGMLPEMDVVTAKQFYEIADKYAVEELKKASSQFLINNLAESNACEILVLADQHSDQDFRTNTISYLVDKKIPQREKEWSNFCENYSKLAMEVLNLYAQKY